MNVSQSMYATIDSLVHDRAPWIYLYHPVTFYATGDGVSGFEPPVVYLGADYSGVRKKSN